ncbi:MAG: adenylate/guanylate cyclase domain-containing protein, partial [Pseudomonadota bacterium]
MLCHNCGTLLQAGARFCSNCGERTVAVRPGSRGTEPPGRLKTALTEPWEGLDGATLSAEKKLVSVLFADIVGSTQVVSRHDPETALHFLDSIMSIFERDVTYFGGVVIRLLGDGILALFGAPKADENHARHACLAALRIQASVKTSAGFPLGEALEPASVRIGISTGEVILRSQKAGQATEHLVTGLSAHLSARLQQAADKGSIFCDNATRMLSKPENFLWHSRGAMAFRGFADPVDVQELLSTVGVQARVGATLGTPGVAFVGRHAAMAEARRFILARGDRQARAMLISGEAGIGKTRFCRELLRRSEGWSEPRGAAPVEDARLKSVRVECTSYGQHTPLAPFAAIVRAHLDRLGASSDQEIRAALDARAPGLAMGPVADVPDAGGGGVGVATALRPQDFALGIRAVLGMELRDPAWTALDASQRRLIVFDSVTRVISAMADGSNIFVIENVHWIDDESRELLDHLLAVCAGETVFILTSRETPELPAGHQGRVLHVALEELDRHEALDLIGRCLDENASRASAEAVHQRTGGNPFFIIEYVKELTERRLQPAAGEVEAGAGGTPDGVRLPATLRALLGARIDARQPGEKRLIRLCAVAGGELPAEIVSACLPDLTGSEIEALVGRLTQEGYLRERDMGGTIVYRLAVSMLQDVVLSSLLTTQRRHLHERILRAMEAVHGGAVQSNTEVAAYHAKMSDSTEEAIRYSWEAGRRAIDRSAY